MWFTVLRHDKRPAVLLNALANELASEGITLIDSTKYCAEHLASPGVMTRRQPTEAAGQRRRKRQAPAAHDDARRWRGDRLRQ